MNDICTIHLKLYDPICLQTRIDMIGAACESAEKIITEARKAYFGTRQGAPTLPTIDKIQAAKIQEQENLLRSAVNHGEGLYLSPLPFYLFSLASLSLLYSPCWGLFNFLC